MGNVGSIWAPGGTAPAPGAVLGRYALEQLLPPPTLGELADWPLDRRRPQPVEQLGAALS